MKCYHCKGLRYLYLCSAAHCEKYLQLFFTLLDKSSLECVRANAVVAASDLACRFPNLLEPWTPYIYARLVKSPLWAWLSTSKPCPHLPGWLIMPPLSGTMHSLFWRTWFSMIWSRSEVKSAQWHAALKIRTQEFLTWQNYFFMNLQKRLHKLLLIAISWHWHRVWSLSQGNALYNVLPDIISHMSDPASGTPTKQNSFQNTVKWANEKMCVCVCFYAHLLLRFLFGFIQKDRMCESLVEKLCHRFRATRSNKQVHDLAYCLTLLPASERSLRKLQENLPCYQDKLVDPQVYSSFTTIMNKMKKLSKPELKVSWAASVGNRLYISFSF